MSTTEIIWKDRKRILGMPISFTKYSICEDRLFCQQGFFNTSYQELLLYRVRDISLSRTLGQKFFGVGTVTINSSDTSSPVLELKNIKRAFEVKEMLHKQVEATKIARRVRVGELMGTGAGNEDQDMDGIPDYME